MAYSLGRANADAPFATLAGMGDVKKLKWRKYMMRMEKISFKSHSAAGILSAAAASSRPLRTVFVLCVLQ